MDEIPLRAAPAQRNLWVRALLMLLFAAAFQLAASLLLAVAVVQLVLAAVGGGSNPRLADLGCSLGRYLGQVAGFEAFCTEDPPFPFAEWPRSTP